MFKFFFRQTYKLLFCLLKSRVMSDLKRLKNRLLVGGNLHPDTVHRHLQEASLAHEHTHTHTRTNTHTPTRPAVHSGLMMPVTNCILDQSLIS